MLGGHMEAVQPIESIMTEDVRRVPQVDKDANPNTSYNFSWKKQ
jgi:hypothetical protein